ncbi:hypothetical protein [Vibrio penaeicida]|uniref:hypothetical protein n=1 Tax=Vibrio penaeicida TaxID=104609 RepID=UPI001CC68398|nr:hypothetical protein [Vibrio penaeicida]
MSLNEVSSLAGADQNDEVEIIEQALSDYACEYVNAIVHSSEDALIDTPVCNEQ